MVWKAGWHLAETFAAFEGVAVQTPGEPHTERTQVLRTPSTRKASAIGTFWAARESEYIEIVSGYYLTVVVLLQFIAQNLLLIDRQYPDARIRAVIDDENAGSYRVRNFRQFDS